ncbi:MAG: hypothetical protein ACYC4Q_06905 [Victivallaceae bacterium]
MRIIRLFTIIASSAVVLLAGCKSTEKTKLGEFGVNENDALKVAQAYANDILNGIKTNDYQLFSKNFQADSKEKITEKNFKAIVKDMTEKVGTIQKWTYVAVLNKTPLKSFVWKASFQKEIKDKDNKPVSVDTEMLFQLLLGKTDTGYVILSFYFQ